MTDLEVLGNLIRERRRGLKLTQDQLAERAKLHSISVARIETGMLNVTFNTLLRLATALETDICTLICASQQRKSEQDS